MQRKVVDWLCNLQNQRGILKAEDRSLYEYAYRLLLSRVLMYFIIIALGIITGNWLEMFSFLWPFVLLRQYVGGIHLEKSTSCICVSSFLVLICGEYLAQYLTIKIPFLVMWIIAVVVIFALAPVDTGSKRLEEVEKKVYGKHAKILLSIEVVIAGCLELIGVALAVKGIAVAHIILASSLILGDVKNFFEYKLAKSN